MVRHETPPHPRNFCRSCGKDFTGVRGFDEHRVGDFAPGEYVGDPKDWNNEFGRRCAVGAVLSVGVEHDDDCRCVAGDSPMTACTCEIVRLTIRRLA